MPLFTLVLACTGQNPAVTPPEDTQSVQDSAPQGLDLRAWFSDYDAGEGLDYLEDPGTHLPDGDPRITGVPHAFHQDVPYGPHARTELDLWVPADPGALLIYFHGGGFVGGDRSDLDLGAVEGLLGADVAVATVNYRFGYHHLSDMEAPDPQGEGTDPSLDGARLDTILRDCARSVQYLRYREDLGVDALPTMVIGGSAGGGCAAWIGATDDLADADRSDPVLRESTRVQAVVHATSQVTLDFSRWAPLLEVEEAEVRALLGDYPAALTQSDADAVWEAQPIGEVLDYAGAWDAGDPVLWVENGSTVEAYSDDPLHHPSHALALYEACVAAGGDCTLRTASQQEGREGSYWGMLLDLME